MTIIQVSKKGISAIVRGSISHAYSITGNPVVQVGVNGAEITSISPAPEQGNGYMLNVPGDNQTLIYQQNTVPVNSIKVKAGDVIYLTKVSGTGTNVRNINWPSADSLVRSAVDEVMCISFVPYVPTENQVDPPYNGRASNPIVQFFRNNMISQDMLDFSRVPKLVDLSLISDNVPTYDDVVKMVSDIWGDSYNGWSTDTSTPAYQNPGYGREVATATSRALIYALSTNLTEEQRRRLITLLVSQGVSLAMAFGDGRVNQANGGHMQGRKALVVFAGYVLNIAPMMDPNWLGFIFQEDHMWRKEPNTHWWFDQNRTIMWRRASEYRFPCDLPPSQWTSTQKWEISGYYHPSAGTNIGTAVAMSLLGLKKCVGENFVQGIKEWMLPVPESVRQELNAAVVNVPFNKAWPQPWFGRSFEEQLWDVYGGQV